VVFLGGVQLATGKTFTFDVGSMNVVNLYASPGSNITIPGGKILISSAGSVGTPAAPLVTTVDKLLGPSTVTGQLNLRNTQDLAVTGQVRAGGNIYLSSSTGLFQNSATILSDTGTVTLEGNTMTLGAAITGPAGINLQPYTPGTTIGVFGGAGAFSISNAEFDLLVGTSPVTIGRSNGTGNVEVGGRNPIGRSLTVQSPLLPNVSPGPQGTFTVTGLLDTASSGANINLDAGGGYFTAQASISAGDVATRNGSVRITAQTIDISPGALVTANGPGNNVPGVYLANGVGGNVYIATSDGALATDLVITPTTLGRISSTGPVSFGRLTNPDGSVSSDIVFLGKVTIGGGGFPFGGLTLLAGNSGSVQLRGEILSNSKPVYIDGPLVLVGPQTITMNSTGTGADLSILNGIRGDPTSSGLTINMGTGANTFTLASQPNTFQMGKLTLNLGGASVFLGSAALSRGLTLEMTDNFTLPGIATLQGGPISLQVDGAGKNLSVQNLIGQQNLTLTTTGANSSIDANDLDTLSLTINSQGNVTVTGSIQTTTTTSISGGTGDTVNLQAVTAGTGVSLSGDAFVLNQTVTAKAGNVSLTKTTLSSPLILGTGGDLDALGMLRLQAPAGEVILGAGTTGGVRLQGPIDLSSSGTSNYAILGASGGLTFAGGSPVLSLRSGGKLRLSLGTGSVVSSGGTDLSIPSGELVIDRAGQVTIRTAISTVRQTPGQGNLAGLSLVNVGSLTLAGAFNTGTGNILVQTLSGNLTLGGTMEGGLIQLGAAQNFINQTGLSQPFQNNGGRTLIYSAGQRYDSPYNFAGLNGFGVAFGQGFGSMPGSGNFLVYSSYAQVGLNYGVVYGEMFAGNSTSALLMLPSDLFISMNGLTIPKVKEGGYLEYYLYPQRVDPEGVLLPPATMGQLEKELGRPPTVQEIVALEARERRKKMMRTGSILERSSFDAAVDEENSGREIRADRPETKGMPVEGGKPQAEVLRLPATPTAQKSDLPAVAPQARNIIEVNKGAHSPLLRPGPTRSVALRDENENEVAQTRKILEEERVRAEVGVAQPVADRY
jgi:hypothetical protein